MSNFPRIRLVHGFVLSAVAGAMGLVGLPTASAFKPESPEVKELVAKGLAFLETRDDGRLGGKCLIGLAFLKNGAGEEHPKIVAAIKLCQQVCQGEPATITTDIYSTGIALIFLCEVNPSKYQAEINKLYASLQLRQRPQGGWGYPADHATHGATGDTSMTQYAVLGTWTAHRSGVINVSADSAQRVCNWLIRTQDPSGGWGYQGNDPGPGQTQRIRQTTVRHSLTAAGLGSALICGDLLGLIKPLEPVGETGLPSALQRVRKQQADARQPLAAKDVSPTQLREAVRDGNRWFAKNYVINPEKWPYYYMYALERYQSFREMAEGKINPEPAWYNDGVKFLRESQQPDGNWSGSGGETVSTAFGVLFLLRSTRKMIDADYGDGQLTGGRGLPTDTTSIRVRKGQIVSVPLTTSADDLLALLDDPDQERLDALVETDVNVALSEDPRVREGQVGRLRRMVSQGPYAARKAAVQALAGRRSLDDVPVLIYALGDPDWRVAREARDALRSISRKFTGFGLTDGATKSAKQRAIENWKQWYLSIRPDAEFLD